MPRWSPPSVALAALLAAAPAHAQSLDSLVLRLTAMSAVTGLEDAMADTLRRLLPGAAQDRAGNVVQVRGAGAPVRVVACPMDELGYVVGGITDEGYLTLRRVGGSPVGALYDQFLEGHRVTVFGRRGPVPGVVGVRSVHLTRGRAAGPDDPFNLDHAYVDVGATSAASAQALGIAVLAPVTRAKLPHAWGPQRDLVAAPWAGQRSACAALVSAALRAPAAGGTTVVAFTRRRHFGQDGLAFLLRAWPGADLLELGLYTTTALGSGPSASQDTAGERVATRWHLPAAYPRTPVESVALSDVRVLEAQLARWIGGQP